VTSAAGFDPRSEITSVHERLAIPQITITDPGYVYIFVSNESEDTRVWFDDLQITHQRSNIVAGADYYPFGLPMENREITREDYRHGYQGQYSEKDKETGFNFFDLRLYDARIGRTLSPDPYGQFASPYSWVGNNPVSGVDPTGGWCPTCLFEMMQNINKMMGTMLAEVTVTASRIGISGAVASGAFNVIARSGYQLEFGNIGTPSFTIGDNFGTSTSRDYVSPGKTYDDWLKTYNPPSTQIGPWNPGLIDSWSASSNILAQASYEIADGAFVTSRFFMPWRYPVHLNGAALEGWDGANAFVTTASTIMPVGRFPKNLKKGYTLDKVFGDQFARYVKTVPGRVGGAARKVYIKYKNIHGKTIKYVKDTYTKHNKFWERKSQPID
jgi:RHS repeat-associated protein